MKSIPTEARLFGAALLVYIVCPPFLSYDSYFTVPTALSLLRHGTTAVDSFVPAAPPEADYAVECVMPGAAAVDYWHANGCNGGHWRNYFPVGVPILATPVIAGIQGVTDVIAALHPAPITPAPQIAAFFAGDLMGGRPLTELACASLFGALSVALQYAIARRFLSRSESVGFAFLFGFGTSQWSLASRNLEQHGLTVLLLSAAVYCVVRAADEPRWIALAGLPLALSVVVRPTNVFSAVAFTILVAVRYRSRFLRFLAGAAPVAAAFFTYNLLVLHSLFPLYYGFGGHGRYPLPSGLAVHLFSPARGIFVFTPVFAAAIGGAVLAIRRGWLRPLPECLVVVLVLHTLVVSAYWDGHTYGPRYLSDMTPYFCLLLIPAYLYWKKLPRGALRQSAALVFVLLAAWGVFVHGHGATSIAANQWSISPVNVDQATWRVWDWHDPQFLRGLR